MSVLITGGTGFLGANVARHLVERGEEVVLFDSAPNQQRVAAIPNRVKLIRGDLGCWTEVLNAVKENEIKSIFHLGALLSQSAEDSPFKSYDVNFNGSYHILEAARLFGVRKVIYVSSIASFGLFRDEPVMNETPQYPLTIYGVSKVFTERLGLYYHHRFQVDFRAVRFPAVIGPGRGPGGASTYSTLMIEYPALGRPYDICVEPRCRMPLLYVKDAVRALVELHDARSKQLTRRSYNIGGISPTAGEICEAVQRHLPEAGLRFIPDPALTAIIDSWPDTMDETVARTDWGWETSYDLETTVQDFIRELQQ